MTLNDRTAALLESASIPYEVTKHPPTFTADATAAAAHVPEGEFAKVVIVQARRGPLLAVVPASRHVDLEALADAAGTGPLLLASESECQRMFPDCEVGAMPALGNLYGLPVLVDARLAHARDISFEGGTHREVVRMAYSDFERLTFAERGEFCR